MLIIILASPPDGPGRTTQTHGHSTANTTINTKRRERSADGHLSWGHTSNASSTDSNTNPHTQLERQHPHTTQGGNVAAAGVRVGRQHPCVAVVAVILQLFNDNSSDRAVCFITPRIGPLRMYVYARVGSSYLTRSHIKSHTTVTYHSRYICSTPATLPLAATGATHLLVYFTVRSRT